MRKERSWATNCFTVTEGATPGIRTWKINGEVMVVVGHGDGQENIPVSRTIRDLAKTAVAQGLYPGLVSGMMPKLMAAELVKVEEQWRLIQATRYSHKALVLVQTSSGIGGQLLYTAAAYDEQERNSRIERQYRPFPSPGVDLIAVGPGSHADEVQALVSLLPNATFRLQRTGQVDGLPRGFTIRWTGHNLVCAPFGAARTYRERAA